MLNLQILRQRLSRAYENGKTQMDLARALMWLDSAAFVTVPGNTVQERQDYVKGIVGPIHEQMRQISEERTKYGFLERIAHNRGYKAVK